MSQQIENNMVVSVDYRLHADAPDGQLIEDTADFQPLKFLFGSGQLLPAFEENLEGLASGDGFDFKIDSDKAYGPYQDRAIMELDKAMFMKDDALIPEVQLDAVLPMSDEKGNRLDGKVLAITDAIVKMDFNHPMAGKDLFFSGKVVEIREATPEEMEHGHAH